MTAGGVGIQVAANEAQLFDASLQFMGGVLGGDTG